MELKVIQRDGLAKEVIVKPSREGAIVTGVVAAPELIENEGLIEKVGTGVLLVHIPPEAVVRVEEDPSEKLEEFLRPVSDRPHSIKLVNGAEGIIYEALDRDLEPVRGSALILSGFNEYDPHREQEKLNPLFGPMGSIDSR